MLSNIETTVIPPAFDPEKEFSLSFGATEHELFSVFPKLIEKLRSIAPNLKLKILPLDTNDVVRQVENLDFIFFPLKPGAGNLKSLKLLDHEYVTIYDQNVRKAPISSLRYPVELPWVRLQNLQLVNVHSPLIQCRFIYVGMQ